MNDVGSDCCGTIVGDWQGLTAGGGRREDQGAATLKGLPRGGGRSEQYPKAFGFGGKRIRVDMGAVGWVG